MPVEFPVPYGNFVLETPVPVPMTEVEDLVLKTPVPVPTNDVRILVLDAPVPVPTAEVEFEGMTTVPVPLDELGNIDLDNVVFEDASHVELDVNPSVPSASVVFVHARRVLLSHDVYMESSCRPSVSNAFLM